MSKSHDEMLRFVRLGDFGAALLWSRLFERLDKLAEQMAERGEVTITSQWEPRPDVAAPETMDAGTVTLPEGAKEPGDDLLEAKSRIGVDGACQYWHNSKEPGWLCWKCGWVCPPSEKPPVVCPGGINDFIDYHERQKTGDTTDEEDAAWSGFLSLFGPHAPDEPRGHEGWFIETQNCLGTLASVLGSLESGAVDPSKLVPMLSQVIDHIRLSIENQEALCGKPNCTRGTRKEAENK